MAWMILREYLEGFWSDVLSAYGDRDRAERREAVEENIMLEPIVTTIEVPCGQERAFNVFVNDMPTWWPLDKRSMSI